MKIFIIAGEASGDRLGAAVIRALKEKRPSVNIRGIGGESMKAAGLHESFFPMEELSIMGIAEIVPRVPHMLRRIRQTVEAIRVFDPDIVLSIDAPDFALRVQKKLKAVHCQAKRVHMVAPTVWAWRAGRAKKIAAYLDAILCLYPFEPDYFLKENLQAFFIGHPLISSGVLDGNGGAFRFRHMIGADRKILGLFFGSRGGEIEKLSPIVLDVASRLQQSQPDLLFLAPTVERWHQVVENLLQSHGLKSLVISDEAEKWDAFAACDAALAVSGTVGLEIAAAGIPHAILYRMNELTWQVVDRVVKTPYAHLANILLNKEIVPEFIQGNARTDKILPVLEKLLSDAEERNKQRQGFGQVRELLKPDGQKKPADIAAGLLIDMAAENQRLSTGR